MRILVLTSLFPPHAVGGYDLACGDVVARWRAAGHDVHVLTSSFRLPETIEAPDEGVSRVLTRYYDDPLGENLALSHVDVERRLLRDHAALRRTLRHVRPEIVSVWHPGGLSSTLLHALGRRRVPTVFYVCDPWPRYVPWSDITARRMHGFHRRTAPLEDVARWVHCSRALRDEMAERAMWRPATSSIVPLGVDLDTFPIQPAADRPWGGRLLFVGRLVEEKGVRTAVRALAVGRPDWTLDVVGVGTQEDLQELTSVADNFGVRQRLTIRSHRRAGLSEVYRSHDVLLFPSTWNEPFGIVPLEAMTAGTPVVATGRGGSGEYLVDGQNCLLFDAGDPARLADAVQRLADDSALRARLAHHGRTTAQEHSMDRTADLLLAELETALAATGPRSH